MKRLLSTVALVGLAAGPFNPAQGAGPDLSKYHLVLNENWNERTLSVVLTVL